MEGKIKFLIVLRPSNLSTRWVALIQMLAGTARKKMLNTEKGEPALLFILTLKIKEINYLILHITLPTLIISEIIW